MDKDFISRLMVVLITAGCLCAQEHQVAITIDDLPRGGDSPGSATADRAMTIKLLTPFKNDKIPLTGFVNECRHPEEVQDLLRRFGQPHLFPSGLEFHAGRRI